MTAYSSSTQEARRARELLQDWRDDGLITPEQFERMQQETVCDLRSTNIFLRLVLFFFTFLIVGAAIGLFFLMTRPRDESVGIFLLFFAAVTYVAAEKSVSQARLYRYGIEEALAVCSVAFLCIGIQLAFFHGIFYSVTTRVSASLVPAAGAMLSLWIWHRFLLPYAFLGSIIFIAALPYYWTSSAPGRHMIVALFFAAGLAVIAALRRRHRLTYLNIEFSIAEALLWLGLYLAINIQISATRWWDSYRNIDQFAGPFHWAAWVLTWCVPPFMLTRGLLRKDRFVIAVGAISAILTLGTNKMYLGLQRHTWDPMLLGALLITVALLVRYWLAKSPNGIRAGFTARRLTNKDKQWINVGVGTIGLVSPHVVTTHAQTTSPDTRFGGGDSGGAGATSDF